MPRIVIDKPRTGKYGARKHMDEVAYLSRLQAVAVNTMRGEFADDATVDELFRHLNLSPRGRILARSFIRDHGSGNFDLDAVEQGNARIIGRRCQYYRTDKPVATAVPRAFNWRRSNGE